jgi:diguanylate cyclase (GGDEF)-like protein
MDTANELAPIVASLRKSLATMELAVSALPDPVAVLDGSKRFAWVNAAFEKMVANSRLMLIGCSFCDVVSKLVVNSESKGKFRLMFSDHRQGQLAIALYPVAECSDAHCQPKSYMMEWSPGQDRESSIVIFKDIDSELELIRLEEKSRVLERKVLSCPLTGLLNREGFLASYWKLEEANRYSYAIFFLDLDGFKFINDSYGHDTGDFVLKTIANRIKQMIRASDFAARLSGDEFALAIRLREGGSVDEVKDIASRFVGVINQQVLIDQKSRQIHVNIRVSLGVTFVEEGDNISDLLARADGAMYRAKSSPSGHVSIRRKSFFESIEKSRILTSQVLASAIESDEIPLHVQPICDVSKGIVVGYEALMRPKAPSGLDVPIKSLLRVASDSAQLVELESVVFSSAARLIRYNFLSTSSLTLAVNVSVLSLSRMDFVERLISSFSRIGFPLDRLIVEVTESDLIQNIDQVRDSMIRLRAAGCRVYLDDFCTGHTGFGQLIELPVDGFKIDQDFVSGVMKSRKAQAVIKTLADIGRSLELDVVVEGVESREQLDLVCSMGMSLCQGFLLGIPEEPSRFDANGDGIGFAQRCSIALYKSDRNPFNLLQDEVF